MALGRKGAGRRGEGEAPVWVCGVAECTALTAAGSCTAQDVLRCLASDNEDCGLAAVPGEQRATHTDAQRVLRYQRRAGSWGGGAGRSGICQDLGIKDAEKITVLGRV